MTTATPTTVVAAPIAVRPDTAAEMLAIGATKLWEVTQPRGPLRCIRIGRGVRYRVTDLDAYAASLAGEGGHE